MKKDAESKNEIIQEIEKLNQELEELNFTIAKKEEIRNEYDKVIINTELAYNKLLEGSKVLLAILKRDEANLQKKLGDNYSIVFPGIWPLYRYPEGEGAIIPGNIFIII